MGSGQLPNSDNVHNRCRIKCREQISLSHKYHGTKIFVPYLLLGHPHCYKTSMSPQFTTYDGTKLHFESHDSAKSKSVLIIVHGLNEHIGRYHHVVDFFKKDHTIYLYDQRGFGRSEGKRSHVDKFEDYVQDLKSFIKFVRQHHDSEKIFMIGHSMGGQVLLNYLGTETRPLVNGFVTSSPNIRVALQIHPLKRKMGAKVASHLPTLLIAANVSPDLLSHDTSIVNAYRNDPMVSKRLSVRLASEVLSNQEHILDLASSIKIPALMLHGGGDKICDPQGSVDFFERLGSKDKTLKIFDGLYHEIFNEFEKETVLGAVATWLQGR